MRRIEIAPSILAADFVDLAGALEDMHESEVDYVHCDVMDGNFVPAITFGAQAVAAIKRRTHLPIDVHLMTRNPELHIDTFINAGADYISFHVEACKHPHVLLQRIREKGVKASIALNPGTSICSIEYLLSECDMVLLMSVNPGAGGQKFIADSIRKTQQLVDMREKMGLHFDIEMDGGLDAITAPKVIQAGVNILVAGSAFFSAPDKRSIVKQIRGY